LFYTFLTWKHAFVRADKHVLFFFCSFPLLFCMLFIYRLPNASSRINTINTFLLVGAALLCLIGNELQERGRLIAKISHWPRSMAERAVTIKDVLSGKETNYFFPNNKSQFELAAIRKTVGRETIDVMGHEQWAALANDLNYRPRPVIQGYSAYTPYLQDINQRRLMDPDSPKYLLYNSETIDDRLPMLDDSAAIAAMLNNYIPVAQDDKFILMRYHGSLPLNFFQVNQQTLRFGEKLDLSKWNREPVFISIKMTPTLIGRIVKLIYKLSPQYIHVETSSGRLRYRFVPIMGERPFLITPLIRSNPDLLAFYSGTLKAHVNNVTFERPQSIFEQVHDRFTVTIYRAEHLSHHKQLSSLKSALTETDFSKKSNNAEYY
jgi:hypothetical protein